MTAEAVHEGIFIKIIESVLPTAVLEFSMISIIQPRSIPVMECAYADCFVITREIILGFYLSRYMLDMHLRPLLHVLKLIL